MNKTTTICGPSPSGMSAEQFYQTWAKSKWSNQPKMLPYFSEWMEFAEAFSAQQNRELCEERDALDIENKKLKHTIEHMKAGHD